MYDYSFVSDSGYFGMAQSLYLGLFNDPQGSGSSGLSYWEGVLQYDTIAALDAFSYYANLNGSPITTSNIGAEVNNIYENLIGTSASSSAQQYWAGLWSGDGGSLSIAQIAVNVYDYMESLPSSSTAYSEYTLRMENHLLNYYDEAQALYIGLMGTNPTSSGLSYWNNALFSSSTAALNSFSNYVTYNGQTISVSNIDNEIVNIYKNLEGNTSVTASSNAVKYWASQWTGNGGTLSIGQILIDIYDAAQALPYNNQYYEQMNANIDSANVYISLSNAISTVNTDINPVSYDMLTSFNVPVANSGYSSSGNYITCSYEYTYAFPSSTSQSDTIDFTKSPGSLTITNVNGNTYYGNISYAFTGDASGHNTVDVGYQASGTNLVDYLTNASNFQTLDFNYNGNTDYVSLTLDLAQINSGFVNFVLDNSGFQNSFTFNNAANNDTFIVQSAISSLTINDATGNTSANVIMEGVNIAGFIYVNFGTLNIDSVGQVANSIKGIDSSNTAIVNYTLNISGTQPLTIGTVSYGSYYGSFPYDGDTLSINDISTAKLTIYTGDASSSGTAGVTINLSGSSAPVTVYDVPSNNSPDKINLGSGSDTVNTDNGNSIITVGSGQDTVAVYSKIDQYSLTSTNYSGHITAVEGNSGNYSLDSIIFGSISSSAVSINPTFNEITVSATSENQAISSALQTLNTETTSGDSAAYFSYGGNTYIINDYNYFGANDQVVKLAGNVSLVNVTISGHTITIN